MTLYYTLYGNHYKSQICLYSIRHECNTRILDIQNDSKYMDVTLSKHLPVLATSSSAKCSDGLPIGFMHHVTIFIVVAFQIDESL